MSNMLTFVDGVQQQGFLGQYPSSFEIHDYYDDKNVVAFNINFDNYDTSQAFYDYFSANYPECYIDLYDDGMCEVRQDLFDDFDGHYNDYYNRDYYNRDYYDSEYAGNNIVDDDDWMF